MARLTAGELVLIVDLRSTLVVETEGFRLPGALHVAPEELERRHPEIARDRDLVLYCS